MRDEVRRQHALAELAAAEARLDHAMRSIFNVRAELNYLARYGYEAAVFRLGDEATHELIKCAVNFSCVATGTSFIRRTADGLDEGGGDHG